MGHEASGVIERAGAAVRGYSPGDRVTFDSTEYCGVCHFCLRGLINLCDNRRVLGVSCGDYRRHGAFAEFIAVPERILYPLPEGVSFEQAAMTEPVSIAVHAVERVPLRFDDTVVVVGAGMIGLLVVQTLRARGCGRLIAVDLADDKLALARRFGADETVNSSHADAVTAVMDWTGGRGADVAFEVVGATAPLRTAIACVRKGGSVGLVGNISPGVEMPLQAVVTRQIALFGSCSSCLEYPACLNAIARGAIDVDAMMSAAAPLEEGPAWFKRLKSGEPGLMKVVLRP
ncbi:MAG: D-arabitol-phosphate dehydrogenase [candidate division BRC1 bacterium ADurb.BinA364]|nr:MAG: D-arabitol-phosphate dehydrogenase [candidate division BRC1 bacterium ADurb.BinA364]